jgi:hypothetical protein
MEESAFGAQASKAATFIGGTETARSKKPSEVAVVLSLLAIVPGLAATFLT